MSSYFSESVARLGVGTPFDADILSAGSRYMVDPALIKAVIASESSWNPGALRVEAQINDASYGLMQILLKTAQGMLPGVTPSDLFIPSTNIDLGTRYLAGVLQQFGYPDGVAAYNAGPGNVSRGTIPASTRLNYVPTVDQFYSWYTLNDPAFAVPSGGGTETSPFPQRDAARQWRLGVGPLPRIGKRQP